MSLAEDRSALAAALSTVDGVTGVAYRPPVLAPGTAWPLLGQIARDVDFQVTWRAVIILPTGERKASDWFDANYQVVADAIEESDFGYLEQVEPGLVATHAGDLEAMIITVRKEA